MVVKKWTSEKMNAWTCRIKYFPPFQNCYSNISNVQWRRSCLTFTLPASRHVAIQPFRPGRKKHYLYVSLVYSPFSRYVIAAMLAVFFTKGSSLASVLIPPTWPPCLSTSLDFFENDRWVYFVWLMGWYETRHGHSTLNQSQRLK